MAFELALVASSWAHGNIHSGSHPVLFCSRIGRHLWRLGLSQDKQRAVDPSPMKTKSAK